MKITLNNNLWQVGTGDSTRDYFEIFLRYGVAIVGPGNPGRDGEEQTSQFYRDHPHITNWGAELRRIQEGDWVIARSGKTRIMAVGQVTGGYDHSPVFEDVEGWDLQHLVRVKWYQPITEDKILHLQDSTMRWVTTSVCNNQEVRELIAAADFEEAPPSLTGAWKMPEKLKLDNITDALIDAGTRIQDAENVTHTIRRIIRLTEWYNQNDYYALEHELRAFLILPFMISLGWSEQKIKLEYDKIDVALFSKPYVSPDGKNNQSPLIILEAKNFDNGLAFTDYQIKRYSDRYPQCGRFIITNGYRYLEMENGKPEEKGYFNLLRLRKSYALKQYLPGYYSTIETMLKMTNF